MEIKPMRRKRLLPILIQAYHAYADEKYLDAIDVLPPAGIRDHRAWLTWGSALRPETLATLIGRPSAVIPAPRVEKLGEPVRLCKPGGAITLAFDKCSPDKSASLREGRRLLGARLAALG
jgi:hypothetical protein